MAANATDASNPPALTAPTLTAQVHLGRTILSALLVSLSLGMLTTVLTLPGDIGPEQFLSLGAIDLTSMDRVSTAWWHLVIAGPVRDGLHLALAAVAYFALDTALFVPLYSWLVFEMIRRAAGSAQSAGSSCGRIAAQLLAYVTAALVAIDFIENSSGLAALDHGKGRIAIAVVGLLALAAGILYWRLRLRGFALLGQIANVSAEWRRTVRIVEIIMLIGVVFTSAVLLGAAFERLTKPLQMLAGYVHAAKNGLTAVVLLSIVARGIYWLFSNAHDPKLRAALRRAFGDLLIRVRYVLLALGLLIAFTLVLDQCRDVALSVADGLTLDGRFIALLALALSVLAIWAMAFSAWFWTRLICRMKSPKDADAPEESAFVNGIMQLAAKQAARALGLVPLVVSALLSGKAARDAVWAAHGRAAQDPQAHFQVDSPTWLLAFGILSLVGARLFLWEREKATVKAAQNSGGYWNDLDPGGNWLERLDAGKYRFGGSWGPDALTLPIFALIAAVLVRAVVTLIVPSVSFAFVVIVLSLVSWLGFLGWLSVKERREARPWVLAILALIGALGVVGITDNHEVRVISATVSGALPRPGTQVIGSVLLMIWIALGSWLILRNAGRSRPAHRTRRTLGIVLSMIAASAATLSAIDYFSRSKPPATVSSLAQRRSLEDGFQAWTDQLRAAYGAPGQRVFFVASEGGGIRAAYWTARALQELQTQRPDFNARTFMVTGVSGGALGEALYAACAHEAAPDTCLKKFGARDVLTPMVGAWLFEDALARVLPTSVPGDTRRWLYFCTQPACGFLSRGLWFEQGLEQGLPGLKNSIASLGRPSDPASSPLPHLFLNSTSVESGDRAIASDLQVQWQRDFPDARDQITDVTAYDSTDWDIPLSTAAHNASRFPYFNAIGVLRDRKGHASHLADGGYFDNSGGHTTADVLSAFRSWVELQAGQSCPESEPADCQARKVWLQALQPTIIVIRNGVEPDCPTFWPLARRVPCIQYLWPSETTEMKRDSYAPAKPRESATLQLFVDALGPVATVVNVSGIGANGRRSAGLLERACHWHESTESCVLELAQRGDGSLYPLGWYLSQSARHAIEQQAVTEVTLLRPKLENPTPPPDR